LKGVVLAREKIVPHGLALPPTPRLMSRLMRRKQQYPKLRVPVVDPKEEITVILGPAGKRLPQCAVPSIAVI
jgi:hypothetical protein